MSSPDEPTQQVRRPGSPAAPLPGSLDPLRGHDDPAYDAASDSAGEPAASDPAASDPAASDPAATGVLRLDEIFDEPAAPSAPPSAPPPAPAERVRESTAAAEAPTWTAMPVVPVRSEPFPSDRAPFPSDRGGTATGAALPPMPMAGRPVPVRHVDGGSHTDRHSGDAARRRSELSDRVRADAAAAWAGTTARLEDWLRRDDNGLMMLTALVACVLMIAIAAVGHP
jgi:hypothetical protein